MNNEPPQLDSTPSIPPLSGNGNDNNEALPTNTNPQVVSASPYSPTTAQTVQPQVIYPASAPVPPQQMSKSTFQPSQLEQPLPGQPIVSNFSQDLVNSNTEANLGEDTRISEPRYILTILGVIFIYAVLDIIKMHFKVAVLSVVNLLIWIIALILCWLSVSKIKASGQDILQKREKLKMVLFMSIDPLIAQAVIYYRLKKSLPQVARIALKIGWKIFFIEFMVSIVAVILSIIFNTSALPAASWHVNQEPRFVSQIKVVATDIQSIDQDANNRDAVALQSDCERLKTDVVTLKQIPAYPVSSIASKILEGENSLSEGANNCIVGIQQPSPALIKEAPGEFLTGLNDIVSVQSTIKGQ